MWQDWHYAGTVTVEADFFLRNLALVGPTPSYVTFDPDGLAPSVLTAPIAFDSADVYSPADFSGVQLEARIFTDPRTESSSYSTTQYDDYPSPSSLEHWIWCPGEHISKGVYPFTLTACALDESAHSDFSASRWLSVYLPEDGNDLVAVDHTNTERGGGVFDFQYRMVDYHGLAASSAEVHVLAPDFTRVDTVTLPSPLAASSSGTDHIYQFAVADTKLDQVGTHYFVLLATENADHKVRDKAHRQKDAIPLVLHCPWNPDIDTDSNNDGSITGADDAIEQDDLQLGRLVGVGDTRAEVILRSKPMTADNELTLSYADDDADDISVWEAATGENSALGAITFSGADKTVWVQGLQPGQRAGLKLIGKIKDGPVDQDGDFTETPYVDTVLFTTVAIDLDGDLNNDGEVTGDDPDDPLEHTAGLIIETGDTRRIAFGGEPSDLDVGKVKLEALSGGSGHIQVWDDGMSSLLIDTSVSANINEEWSLSATNHLGNATGTAGNPLRVKAIDTGTVTLRVTLFNPAGSVLHTDALLVTAVKFDLDVNGNTLLTDAVDGVANYLPGYESTPAGGYTAVLSSGTTFLAPDYLGQCMTLVLDGLGSASDVDTVTFEILACSSKDGFCGNATDLSIDGDLLAEDYSFAWFGDQRFVDVTLASTPSPVLWEGGQIEADRTWTYFTCKDYGGSCSVRVTVTANGQDLLVCGPLKIPLDSDVDGVADTWEEGQLGDWNVLFGLVAGDIGFRNSIQQIAPAGDEELDGIGGIPHHKDEGDGLTALQEYRGFVLDGGGHDSTGGGAHPGGHGRLSTCMKEYLLEVEIMPDIDVANQPAIHYALVESSKGLRDTSNGLGIALYWAIDTPVLPPQPLVGLTSVRSWVESNRVSSSMTRTAVHLIFGKDEPTDYGGGAFTLGPYIPAGSTANELACCLFVDAIAADVPASSPSLAVYLASCTAHELIHPLLAFDPMTPPQNPTPPPDTYWQSGTEHIWDPNCNGVGAPMDVVDQRYLMNADSVPTALPLRICGLVGQEATLKSKQGVTR